MQTYTLNIRQKQRQKLNIVESKPEKPKISKYNSFIFLKLLNKIESCLLTAHKNNSRVT